MRANGSLNTLADLQADIQTEQKVVVVKTSVYLDRGCLVGGEGCPPNWPIKFFGPQLLHNLPYVDGQLAL